MSPEKSFDPSWESKIYSQKKHINRYPFGELVSYVMSLYATDLRAGRRLKALELGFGAGNNLAFLAKEGFDTYGIEGSASACEIAGGFLKTQGLTAHLTQGDFVRLPYSDDFFDLIIDRESVYANRREAIYAVGAEARRCLKRGGRFLSFTYSTEHGSMGRDGGKELEPGTFAEFKDGPFQDAGVTHFFTEAEIRNDYFKGFEIEFIHHHRSDFVFPEKKNHYAEFVTCGRKL